MKMSRLISPLGAFLLFVCALLALPASAQTPSVLGEVTTQVAAGSYHSCALTTAGGVACWGWNGLGELGDGTTTKRNTPVALSGLSSGVLAITAGLSHPCALSTAGGVECWGNNVFGQLGDGSTIHRHTPVAISAGQSITFAPPVSLGLTAEFVDLTAFATSTRPITFDT